MFNNSSVGPLTESQVFTYPVNDKTPVSKDSGPWQPLYMYPELMSKLSEKQAVLQTNSNDMGSKKTICGIMAIILGGLGIQYFILGKVGGGLVTILLTAVTCGLWSILTLVQGILMLTMSEEQFYRKYVNSQSFMPLF